MSVRRAKKRGIPEAGGFTAARRDAEMTINVGDTVITKKTHPCGGNRWTVTRTGADIKLRCDKCGHIVMLDRGKCEKSIKQIIPAEGTE